MRSTLQGMVSLIASLLISHAFASTFETDGAAERAPFAVMQGAGTATDSEDDMVTFDPNVQAKLPPVVADLTEAGITAGPNGWVVTFSIAGTVPEDPGMPVNFNVYVDADGSSANNAPNGIFRTQSDLIVMLLFGTRTKWHTSVWQYSTAAGTWQENTDTVVPFQPSSNTFTFTIPYSLLPQNSPFTAKFQALTSDNAGIVTVDMIPGTGLPPRLQGMGAASSQAQVAAPIMEEPVAMPIQAKIITSLFVMLLGSLFAWWRSSNR